MCVNKISRAVFGSVALGYLWRGMQQLFISTVQDFTVGYHGKEGRIPGSVATVEEIFRRKNAI